MKKVCKHLSAGLLFFVLVVCGYYRAFRTECKIDLLYSKDAAGTIQFSGYYTTKKHPAYTAGQVKSFKNGTCSLPRKADIINTRIDIDTPGVPFTLKSIAFYKNRWHKAVLPAKDIFECYTPYSFSAWKLDEAEVYLNTFGADPYLIPQRARIAERLVWKMDWMRLIGDIAGMSVCFLLLAWLIYTDRLEKFLKAAVRFSDSPRRVYLLLAALFLIAVALGLTGSSIGMLRGRTKGLVVMDEVLLLGKYQDIRTDEYVLRTPFAVGALKNNSPVWDDNYSLGGRNNLVRFYTGVPVKHFTSAAHPQTWGFMLLPLRQALAWYWFFPIFAGIAGIYALLNIFFKEQYRENLLIALATALLPTMAMWSFWTLQVVGYVCGAAALFLTFLEKCPRESSLRENWKSKLLLSLLTGWSAAAVCLLLMAPRLVPTCTLAAIMVIMHIWDEKKFRNLFSRNFFLWGGCGVLLFAVIMGSWYVEAKDVIAAISNTVYPGKRFCFGGGYSLWDTFCGGWWNIYNVYHSYGSLLNVSERSLYFSFIPVCMLLFFCCYPELSKSKKYWGVMLFSVFALVYLVIGIPEIVAKLTQWGKTHNERVNGSLALAQAFMIASLVKYTAGKKLSAGLVVLISAVTLMFFAAIFVSMPQFGFLKSGRWMELSGTYAEVRDYVILGMFLIFVLVVLLCRFVRYFPLGYLLLAASVSLPFNPLCIAPSNISHIFSEDMKKASREGLAYEGRMLSLSDNTNQGFRSFGVMSALYAAGEKVMGEYFFSPDTAIMNLDIVPEKNRAGFNSKGFVYFMIGKKNGFEFIKNGDTCMNRIILAPDFDFTRLPCDYLLTVPGVNKPAPGNKSVKLIGSKKEMNLYKICHPTLKGR